MLSVSKIRYNIGPTSDGTLALHRYRKLHCLTCYVSLQKRPLQIKNTLRGPLHVNLLCYILDRYIHRYKQKPGFGLHIDHNTVPPSLITLRKGLGRYLSLSLSLCLSQLSNTSLTHKLKVTDDRLPTSCNW